MHKTIFITGTDTGVGKTFVTTKLLKKYANMGYSTLGLKPISSGYDEVSKMNDDAIKLMEASSIKLPYHEVNPFAFQEPISPNIAAQKEKILLNVSVVANKIREIQRLHNADITIIEGVGGWRVPLNETENMSDLVKALDLPVILVVGIKLGCLNHAILTYEALKSDGVEIIGWVANCMYDDVLEEEEIIKTLKDILRAKLISCY
jgi:dethiobiotin synthetase